MPDLPPIELWATALALGYVVLAARDSVWCWPLGFVSSCLMTYQVLRAYSLYFDAALNAFYAVMAVVGLVRWTRGGRGGEPAPITPMSRREHAVWIGAGIGATSGCLVLAQALPGAALPLPDATTTVFSVLATVLLIERRLENWLYFAICDAAYVAIYLDRGSVVFAALFALYTVLAVAGYASWRAQMRGLDPNPAHADPLD